MGFRQTEPHRAPEADRSDTTTRVADTTLQRQSDINAAESTADSSHSGITASQADQQYDVDISSRRQLNELQRLEQTHGGKVHDWVDEGMPREAMGTPSDMQAFRTRKDTPVPWNVETHNAQSVQRSTEAAADTTQAGDTGVPDSVRDVISSSGQSLDGSIQRKMESEMGGSFGDVQVHTGPSAANACESINARAFTVGNHVAFNQGEYDPGSPAGQHVIAHELAHVRQQTGGAVSMLPQEGLELEIDPDPQLEREAEQTAQRVMQGGELGIQRLENTDVHVQRMGGCFSKPDAKYEPNQNDAVPQAVPLPKNPPAAKNSAAPQQRPTLRDKPLIEDSQSSQPLPNDQSVKQGGDSCWLAAIQALLATENRDTRALSEIIRNYPLEKNIPGSFNDIFDKFDKDTADHLRKILNEMPFDFDDKAGKSDGGERGWKEKIYVRGILSAIGNVYQSNYPTEDEGKKKYLNEVIATGRNLLYQTPQSDPTKYPGDGEKRDLHFGSDISNGTGQFKRIINELKTPVLAQISGLTTPSGYRDYTGGHAILIYDVKGTNNDNPIVQFRDPNDEPGQISELPLSQFLAPNGKQQIDNIYSLGMTEKEKNSIAKRKNPNKYYDVPKLRSVSDIEEENRNRQRAEQQRAAQEQQRATQEKMGQQLGDATKNRRINTYKEKNEQLKKQIALSDHKVKTDLLRDEQKRLYDFWKERIGPDIDAYI